jgi:sialate O-acetylesterase
VRDVLIGDVWLCGGQSNIEYGIRFVPNARLEIELADHAGVRLFYVPRRASGTPMSTIGPPPIGHELEASWQQCKPNTVGAIGDWGGFSAIGYYFGRALNKELNVPIGMISAMWGGTPIQCWMSRETLLSNEATRYVADDFDQALVAWPGLKDKWYTDVEAWDKQYGASASGPATSPVSAVPRRPPAPPGPESHYIAVTGYNGMIAPVIPFGINGVIWYQGESNAGNHAQAREYRTLFPMLIEQWRREWGRGDFPFYFVQLASFKRRETAPGESVWAELREAQARALSLPNTAMAVAIDVGDADDIHPTDKRTVALRLVKIALANAYGRDLVSSGPTFRHMRIDGSAVRVEFRHAEGLTSQGASVTGFSIAGADWIFYWAEARIERNGVVLTCPSVEKPSAVRYGWADNPDASLYNAAGLPLAPFRSDEW